MATSPGPRVSVIAHRGASHQRPENTIDAFRRAAELGADWVELDVRRTADGATAIHHDAHLPDGRALVALARADVPDAVPTLDAALEACAGMGVNIEIKNVPGEPDFDPTRSLAEVVVAAARRHLGPGRTLVSSFDAAMVERVRVLAPELPTALLVFLWGDSVVRVLDRCAAAGHTAIHPWDGLVDDDVVTLAHDRGLAVNVWTVDDPGRMRTLVAWGVDGLCTNEPDVARQVLGRG